MMTKLSSSTLQLSNWAGATCTQ